MMEQIAPELQSFVVTLVTGLLGVLSAFLIALAKKGFDWLATKIESIKSDDARKALSDAIKNLENLVTTTVTSLQQTLGKDIKESIAADDGRFTYEDLLALKERALTSVKAQMTHATQEALAQVYVDLDAFIADMIEKAVFDMKNQIIAEAKSQKAITAHA